VPLATGARLGRYQIVAPLGSGGMGEVYRAHDTRLHRVVAIKVLLADFAADPRRRERFRREAHAIASFTHPHICNLYDIGAHDGLEFLVMEYLQGETLAQRLLRGALPLEDVLRIAVELADALDVAHRAGFTHRDLKPSNVMLTDAGAKVLDFGLAKRDGSDLDAALPGVPNVADPTLTQVGSVLGTLQYMAPEQREGRPADARSDVFALGAIIYEMRTGRLAASDSPLQTLDPPLLDRVTSKCLATDPVKRWQRASDVRDELDWIGQTNAAPRNDNLPRRSRSWPVWIGAATAAAALILLAAFAISRGSGVAPPPTTSFVVLSPEGVSDVDEPTISPDGRALAFVGHMKNGKSSLWVRPLESLEARPVADTDAFAFPFWSPDSQSLAFFSQGQLKRVRASGGLVQSICAAPSGRGGAWSRDGVIVFAASGEAALSQVPAGGGEPTPVTRIDVTAAERSHRFPQFLSDGRRFIYTVYFSKANQKPVLKAGSLDTPTTTVVTETSFARSFAAPGYLVLNRDIHGPFLAQPFDERNLALMSEPVPIASHLTPGAVGGMTALSVSTNGVLAYQTLAVSATAQLTWFGRSGQKLGTVGAPTSVFDFSFFSLSTDGTRVALLAEDPKTSLDDVWAIDVLRGVTSRVTVDGTAEDPKWSPDNATVAFTSNKRGTGNTDIYVTSSKGNGPAEPLLISAANKFLWDWSRDGAYIIFGVQEGTKSVSNLWVLPLKDPGPPRPYLQSEFDKGEARFSPDSRWVAYQSNESGRSEVYVQAFPKPGDRYQVSTDGGARPRWRGDGQELFYVAPEGRMMAATVAVASTFSVSRVKQLFVRSASSSAADVSYEVSADGQRFLTAEVIHGAVKAPVTVVLNWIPARAK
jgi:serine/threonine protein kinase